MSIKDSLNKVVENVKDTVNEAVHKGTADAERTRRETAGDAMTPGEHLTSMGNELKNDVQGNIDRAKIEARKEV